MEKAKPFDIGGAVVQPGEALTVELPLAYLYTHHDLTMPIRILHGKKPGPVLFVSAALHGDEINGLEIISRLLRLKVMQRLRGTLIAIPVVNVYGFLNQTRYLPDRRDLNRSFPGSESGSLAARMAWIFAEEILSRADFGIDLHTGALHRSNLPQIRADLNIPGLEPLALSFRVPVVLNSPVILGSMREAAQERGVPVLLYECGEALRFDEVSIRAGVRGIVSVMRQLGMLPPRKQSDEHKERKERTDSHVSHTSRWVRTPAGGVLRTRLKLGQWIEKGRVLAQVGDPLGLNLRPVLAPFSGLVIGMSHLPLVDEGNALFHIATFEDEEVVQETLERFQEEMSPEQEVLLESGALKSD